MKNIIFSFLLLLLTVPFCKAADFGDAMDKLSNGLSYLFSPNQDDQSDQEKDLSPRHDKKDDKDAESQVGDCGICFDPCQKKDIKKISCIHIFHVKCLDRWLKDNPSCPLCNKTLGKNQTIYHPDQDEEAQAAHQLHQQINAHLNPNPEVPHEVNMPYEEPQYPAHQHPVGDSDVHRHIGELLDAGQEGDAMAILAALGQN